MKSGVCVPIMHDGKVVSLINFFRQADSSLERGSRASIFSDKGLDYFAQYAYGVVAAGVNGTSSVIC